MVHQPPILQNQSGTRTPLQKQPRAQAKRKTSLTQKEAFALSFALPFRPSCPSDLRRLPTRSGRHRSASGNARRRNAAGNRASANPGATGRSTARRATSACTRAAGTTSARASTTRRRISQHRRRQRLGAGTARPRRANLRQLRHPALRHRHKAAHFTRRRRRQMRLRQRQRITRTTRRRQAPAQRQTRRRQHGNQRIAHVFYSQRQYITANPHPHIIRIFTRPVVSQSQQATHRIPARSLWTRFLPTC